MREVLSDLQEMCRVIQGAEPIPGWQTIKPGSYCMSRRLAKSDSILVSATFNGSNTLKSYELNMIATPDTKDPTATLGLLKVDGENRTEIYRINYKKTHGWHLDSNNYGVIQHRKMIDVKGWRDALNKISSSLETLPFEFPEILFKSTHTE